MKPHPADNRKARLFISTQPNIGLDGDTRRAEVEILNHALTNADALARKKLAWMLRS